MESDVCGDMENPVIEEWYATLISMTRGIPHSELLIEGQGNLGNNVDAPAFPSFTGCRLTDEGRKLAERLFAEHPQYRRQGRPQE